MTNAFSYQSFGVGATRVWNTDRNLVKRWAEEQFPAERQKFWVPYTDYTLLIVKNYIGDGYSVAGLREFSADWIKELVRKGDGTVVAGDTPFERFMASQNDTGVRH